MSETKETRNKALVLEAFDTLSNKRDYIATGAATGRLHTSSTVRTSRAAARPLPTRPWVSVSWCPVWAENSGESFNNWRKGRMVFCGYPSTIEEVQ